jgi:Signal transduction histidine kinase
MIRRLRRRFVLFSMLIVTLVLSVVLSIMFRSARDSIINDSINMMRNIAMNPREHDRPDEKGEDIRLPFFTLRIDESGRVMARGGGYYDLSDEEFLNTLVDYVDISEAETGVIQEYNLRYLKMISPEHKDTIIVFADTSSGENAISGIKTASIVGGVIAFVIFLGLSILLSRLVVKPVEEAWNQQKQFVADASHELKTPLTVIMTNAEMLKEGEFSEGQRNGFVDSILKMSDQMRGLVESLLELSRLDSGSAEMVSGSVNLSSAVSDSALTFEPVFFEKREKFGNRNRRWYIC